MCLAHFLFHGNNGPILLLSSVPFLKKIRGVRVPHQNKLQMGVGRSAAFSLLCLSPTLHLPFARPVMEMMIMWAGRAVPLGWQRLDGLGLRAKSLRAPRREGVRHLFLRVSC